MVKFGSYRRIFCVCRSGVTAGFQYIPVGLISLGKAFRNAFQFDEIKEILPAATIRLVDGEFFSWYGSRLLDAPAYFRELAH